ncbi:phage minor head protein [Vandammella animalimorsus]|uniref:phage head morphogenesis protein n=1 Tax=Vandammella animalimorsus TaxID=2029117 RepID=UPI0031BA8BC4
MSDTPDALTAAEFAQLWRQPPHEAIATMQSRSKLLASYNWQDVYADEHLRNFTVSRLACLDTLQAVYEAVQRATAGDLSRRDFIREVEQTLRNKGWWGLNAVVDPATGETVQTHFNPSRLQLIYDTNTRAAHAAGQWQRIQRNKHLYPYLRYVTVGDEHVRPEHARWHNLTLPVDHPLWQQIYPPNGWRCRCRVVAMRQEEVDAGASPTGAPLRTEPPQEQPREWINRRTGEVRQIVPGVSPGFDYNVGQASLARTGQMLLDKAAGGDARLGALAVAQALQNPGLLDAVAEDFAAFARRWMDAVDHAEQGTAPLRLVNELRHVGALSDAALLRLAGLRELPQSAIISVRAEDVTHTFRGSKTGALPRDWYLQLPRHLREPQAVLFDGSKPNYPAVLLVYPLPDGPQGQKLVVELDYKTKDGREKIITNVLRSGRVDYLSNLKNMLVLDGTLQ